MMSRPNLSPWVSIFRPNPRARLRLFCFPYAGGSSLVFRQWPDGLPPDVELCAVQLPGRGARMRETPFKRMSPLVEALAEVLPPFFDRPFAFFGHSMGATIGFELARRLRRARASGPARLLISGRQPPQAPYADRATYSLSDAALIDELRQLNGTPSEVLEHAEMMQLLLPLLRADLELIQTYAYEPEPPLSCPVSAFGGIRDAEADHDVLQQWAEQTTAEFSLEMFPGDHFFLHTCLPQLLQAISHLLRQT
jgi:medium-chain acyl-[acyl-carrier-protein] hydrolase